MGSTQSFLSPEAAISSAFVAGALAIAYTQFGPKLTPSTPPMLTSTGKGKKGKNKQPDALENSKVVDATATSPEISAVAPSLVPGQFEHTPAEPLSPPDAPAPPKQKNGKKKKAKVASVPAAASSADNHSESSTGTTHPQPAAVADRPSSKPKRQPPMQTPKPIHQSTTSIDTDGSWTRVDPRRRNAQQGTASLAKGLSADVTTSDAGITTSVTGNSSPVAERTKDDDVFAVNMPDAASSGQRRPLAERLLPKPRKTGVDDMLETSDYPALARVMRVQPQPDEKPASGFSWADYEDVHVDDGPGAGNDADGEDDGWGVVKSKGRSRLERNPSAKSPNLKASETLTKKQRQNANKREAQKAVKAESEAQRQALLAQHSRELQRAKAVEHPGKGSGRKATSGGMTASVDEHGKLVWQ